MARSSAKIEHEIFIEVLQNGVTLADTRRSLKNYGRLNLTSRYDGELAIPFYGLLEDINLFRIERKGLFLVADAGWHGFVTSRGQQERLTGKERSQRIVPMLAGDYGSIVSGDLRVIFRVAAVKPQKKVVRASLPKDQAYRGSILRTLIGGRTEYQSFLLAIFATGIIFSGIIFGLATRVDDRPKNFTDLSARYTLPFVHADHLRYIPEAMQQKLDRSDYVASTIRYYRALGGMILGDDLYDENLMMASSNQFHRQLRQKRQQTLSEKSLAQQARDEKSLKLRGSAQVKIPTVVGDDLVTKIKRLNQRLPQVHAGLRENLETRRETTEMFSTLQAYDPTNYNNQKKGSTNDKLAQNFSQINPFVKPTNEIAMYQAVEQLADTASRLQLNARKSAAAKREEKLFELVVIPSDIDFASFLPLDHFSEPLNSKVAQMQASVFGAKQAVRIREPLVGQINPNHVERVIEQNRYELQLCYELALRRNQVTAGSMEWSWRIDTRGQISELKLISTTISDRQMEKCVQEKIARWSFPRPSRGSVEIRYPFSFTPARG